LVLTGAESNRAPMGRIRSYTSDPMRACHDVRNPLQDSWQGISSFRCVPSTAYIPYLSPCFGLEIVLPIYADVCVLIYCGLTLVGSALRHNPFAPFVPCHRVIASNLYIGGFFWRVGYIVVAQGWSIRTEVSKENRNTGDGRCGVYCRRVSS